MDSTFTIGQSVSLAVKCPSEQKAPEAGHAVHKPGDIVPAYMELYKHRSFDAVSLHGSIVGEFLLDAVRALKTTLLTSDNPGETRVWTNPADREDIYQTMIYLHLDQTNVLSHALPLINTASGRDAVIVPITFVLPELVTGSKNTNGRMPPSCEAGRSYVDPWGRLYMQPLIEYFLQVTLRYRLLGETAIRTISAKRKIKITTSPHSEPPTYSQSLLEEKAVKASVDVRKSWFAKPFARLNLAMAEPLPVVGHATSGSCGTVGVLRMDWTTSSEAYDDFELGKRPIRIEYYLRARTRYGTRAIQEDETDSNSTGSNEARPHTRTETKPLGVLEVRSSDRKDVRITASEAGHRSHSGTIPIPIQIEDDTIPTFSHLLASRDYAILVKVSIQGLQHAALSIEVPLQVCENHYAKNCDGTTGDSSVFHEILASEVRIFQHNASQRQADVSRSYRVTKITSIVSSCEVEVYGDGSISSPNPTSPALAGSLGRCSALANQSSECQRSYTSS